ncbi:MAG: prepilin-type N-terminal cleavage/methylation domain-containing protein [Kiritimatiellae bacterium]|nr:prepilin-type N-terminal cleavage/methylation domain-containing protein [Kiritimatiellia bacterium]
MKTSQARSSRSGFTLVELLAVIAIIAILAALVFPAFQKIMNHARRVHALNNGRSIHQSLLAAQADDRVMPQSSGPLVFASSTDYWKWAITNRVIDSTFALFWAHGLTAYPGLDPARFSEANNAWCIAADVSTSTRSVTPILFTRNLGIQRLNEAPDAALTDDPPFGKDAVVVIYRDNSAQMLRAADLVEYFNPGAESNRVLRP